MMLETDIQDRQLHDARYDHQEPHHGGNDGCAGWICFIEIASGTHSRCTHFANRITVEKIEPPATDSASLGKGHRCSVVCASSSMCNNSVIGEQIGYRESLFLRLNLPFPPDAMSILFRAANMTDSTLI